LAVYRISEAVHGSRALQGAFPASVIFGILYQRCAAAAAFATGAVLALASMALFATRVWETQDR
jgi:hypothetical protein